jgi:hypothetical protein
MVRDSGTVWARLSERPSLDSKEYLAERTGNENRTEVVSKLSRSAGEAGL